MDQQASEQFRICFGVLSGLRFGFRVWEPMGLANIHKAERTTEVLFTHCSFLRSCLVFFTLYQLHHD